MIKYHINRRNEYGKLKHLDTATEIPDEKTIMEKYGEGNYSITVTRESQKGARTVKQFKLKGQTDISPKITVNNTDKTTTVNEVKPQISEEAQIKQAVVVGSLVALGSVKNNKALLYILLGILALIIFAIIIRAWMIHKERQTYLDTDKKYGT
ncbi:MAG: hypothetical protein WC974_04530 [Thermoplasmata archaeon]